MKNILSWLILYLFVTCIITVSCDDWTEMEMKNKPILVGTNLPEEYYEQLRAYKRTHHAISFGWYGNWTGKGANLENCLAGLPDSIDLVSIWGNWKNLTPEQIADMKLVQEKKGTKVLMCIIVLDVGSGASPVGLTKEERKAFWGWTDPHNEEQVKAAIEKYANAICDTIDKYGYDGFDLDWEINLPQPFPTDKELGPGERRRWFVETMAKRVGPRSGTGRLLVIDGEIDAIPGDLGDCFDYFIVQTYGASGPNSLGSRLTSSINKYKECLPAEFIASRYVVCETFERYASTGGVDYTDSNGEKMKSLEGMARWNPTINSKVIRKGGVGTYHMEYEYFISGKEETYPAMRRAIQLMNPSVK